MKNLVFIFLLFIPSVLFARIGWNHNGVLAYGGLQSQAQAHSPIVGLRLEIDKRTCRNFARIPFAIGVQYNGSPSFLVYGRILPNHLAVYITKSILFNGLGQLGYKLPIKSKGVFVPAAGFAISSIISSKFYLKSAIYCSSELVYKTKYNFKNATSLNLELGVGVYLRGLRIKKKKPN